MLGQGNVTRLQLFKTTTAQGDVKQFDRTIDMNNVQLVRRGKQPQVTSGVYWFHFDPVADDFNVSDAYVAAAGEKTTLEIDVASTGNIACIVESFQQIAPNPYQKAATPTNATKKAA